MASFYRSTDTQLVSEKLLLPSSEDIYLKLDAWFCNTRQDGRESLGISC